MTPESPQFSKILVTGGAGFIGSHLVDMMVEEGYKVSVIDDLYTGRIENLQSHVANGTVKFSRGDIRDRHLAGRLVKEADAVVHLAAVASVPYSVKEPILTNDVNVNGTLNLLELSVKAKVKKFIFVSSCAVYGEPKYLPIDEKHPIEPLSPYAASKAAAEHYCRAFCSAYGLGTSIMRLFNVYGSRQREDDSYSGVVTSFIRNLANRRPLIIYGDGDQTRDFVHVKDACDAILSALKSDKSYGFTFNVASGKETSINELARLLIRVSGKEAKVIHKSPRSGDLRKSYASISTAKKVLAFHPKTSLEHGLRQLLSGNKTCDA